MSRRKAYDALKLVLWESSGNRDGVTDRTIEAFVDAVIEAVEERAQELADATNEP